MIWIIFAIIFLSLMLYSFSDDLNNTSYNGGLSNWDSEYDLNNKRQLGDRLKHHPLLKIAINQILTNYPFTSKYLQDQPDFSKEQLSLYYPYLKTTSQNIHQKIVDSENRILTLLDELANRDKNYAKVRDSVFSAREKELEKLTIDSEYKIKSQNEAERIWYKSLLEKYNTDLIRVKETTEQNVEVQLRKERIKQNKDGIDKYTKQINVLKKEQEILLEAMDCAERALRSL